MPSFFQMLSCPALFVPVFQCLFSNCALFTLEFFFFLGVEFS